MMNDFDKVICLAIIGAFAWFFFMRHTANVMQSNIGGTSNAAGNYGSAMPWYLDYNIGGAYAQNVMPNLATGQNNTGWGDISPIYETVQF